MIYTALNLPENLVGKFALFESVITGLRLGTPCLIEKQTSKSLVVKTLKTKLSEPTPLLASEYGMEAKTKRQSEIVYVTDTIEEAINLFNLSSQGYRDLVAAKAKIIDAFNDGVDALIAEGR